MEDEENSVRGRSRKRRIRKYKFRESSKEWSGWSGVTKIGETVGSVLDEEFFL